MNIKFFAVGALIASSISPAHAAGIRQFTVHELARPEVEQSKPRNEVATNSISANDVPLVPSGDPIVFPIYPVAGEINKGFYIPYYVDLASGPGLLDWNCTRNTFEGHIGHDPYLRSFREQDIGVPVFTPLDGVVTELHDGEPDHNTDSNPNAVRNYVIIRHSDQQLTEYDHLKRGSIVVHAGDTVTAGTQIAQVGSSGNSDAPHIHFEARYGADAYEPIAGPCRPGRSYLSIPVTMPTQPVVLGTALSAQSFDNYPAPPYDDAPHTGTFLTTQKIIYWQAQIANLPASSTYSVTVRTPNGSSYGSGSGELTVRAIALGTFGWGLDIDLYEGQWAIDVAINGAPALHMPFTVVSSGSQIVNRPPNAISATLQPASLSANNPAICHVDSSADVPDDDYDVLSYHYVWSVDGQTVRDVVTAAREDVLAREFVRAGSALTCNVTATDGKATSVTVSANARLAGLPRRRAASK
jgi:hypothetical protein